MSLILCNSYPPLNNYYVWPEAGISVGAAERSYNTTQIRGFSSILPRPASFTSILGYGHALTTVNGLVAFYQAENGDGGNIATLRGSVTGPLPPGNVDSTFTWAGSGIELEAGVYYILFGLMTAAVGVWGGVTPLPLVRLLTFDAPQPGTHTAVFSTAWVTTNPLPATFNPVTDATLSNHNIPSFWLKS